MSIIIIGGGITGITLTLAISFLTEKKLPITLIEKNDLINNFENSDHNKHVIALSAGTRQHLININIWKLIENHVTPIKYIHISERNNFGICSINSKNFNIEALGYVIELLIIKKIFFKYLKEISNINICCPSKVNKILKNKNNIKVTLSTGESLTSSLLIMADGSLSKLSFNHGIQYKKICFEQLALVSNVTTELSHKFNAFEQFSHEGPLSLLPMSNKQLALVWCHTIYANQEIKKWSDKQFLIYLQKAFGWRLGKFICTSKRLIYPLTSSIAIKPISHRLVLVGNSAQTLHPIAGQGFNLCLRDVMSLAKTLMVAQYQNKDIGSYNILYSYYINRKYDRELIFNFTNNLVKLFANSNPLFSISRNIGLMLINNLPLVRNTIIKYALGWIDK